MQPKLRKIFAFLLCFLLCFEQSGFAQIAGQLDISGHLAGLRNAFVPDVFRPLHLRYLSYSPIENNFQLFLDKGSLKNPNPQELEDTTKILLNYFFIGIALPNESFWVNLRPDAEDNIIDPALAQTDVGKILLGSDLQLKKDTAKFTSPETPEGKEYWDKLYKKAGEIFGSSNITIPTLTRPWIVPDEIIIRETADSAYIYKATLKVMLEQDYLKNSATYSFKDDRLKELNEYSSQLIREIIIPKLNKEINSSKRYAPLRQVYYSLIMAQWFKARNLGKDGLYSHLINRKDLTNLTSKESWSKTTYFKEYQKSFKDGEYNIQEQVYTPTGQVIRSYFSGGMQLALKPGDIAPFGQPKPSSSPILTLPANSSSPVISGLGKWRRLIPVSVVAGALLFSQGDTPRHFEEALIQKPPSETIKTIPTEMSQSISVKDDIGIMAECALRDYVNTLIDERGFFYGFSTLPFQIQESNIKHAFIFTAEPTALLEVVKRYVGTNSDSVRLQAVLERVVKIHGELVKALRISRDTIPDDERAFKELLFRYKRLIPQVQRWNVSITQNKDMGDFLVAYTHYLIKKLNGDKKVAIGELQEKSRPFEGLFALISAIEKNMESLPYVNVLISRLNQEFLLPAGFYANYVLARPSNLKDYSRFLLTYTVDRFILLNSPEGGTYQVPVIFVKREGGVNVVLAADGHTDKVSHLVVVYLDEFKSLEEIKIMAAVQHESMHSLGYDENIAYLFALAGSGGRSALKDQNIGIGSKTPSSYLRDFALNYEKILAHAGKAVKVGNIRELSGEQEVAYAQELNKAVANLTDSERTEAVLKTIEESIGISRQASLKFIQETENKLRSGSSPLAEGKSASSAVEKVNPDTVSSPADSTKSNASFPAAPESSVTSSATTPQKQSGSLPSIISSSIQSGYKPITSEEKDTALSKYALMTKEEFAVPIKLEPTIEEGAVFHGAFLEFKEFTIDENIRGEQWWTLGKAVYFVDNYVQAEKYAISRAGSDGGLNGKPRVVVARPIRHNLLDGRRGIPLDVADAWMNSEYIQKKLKSDKSWIQNSALNFIDYINRQKSGNKPVFLRSTDTMWFINSDPVNFANFMMTLGYDGVIDFEGEPDVGTHVSIAIFDPANIITYEMIEEFRKQKTDSQTQYASSPAEKESEVAKLLEQYFMMPDGTKIFVSPSVKQKMEQMDGLIRDRDIVAEIGAIGLTKETTEGVALVDLVIPERIFDLQKFMLEEREYKLAGLIGSEGLRLELEGDNIILKNNVGKSLVFDEFGWNIVKYQFVKLTKIDKDTISTYLTLREYMQEHGTVMLEPNWDIVITGVAAWFTGNYWAKVEKRAVDLNAKADFLSHHHPHLGLAVAILQDKPYANRQEYYQTLLKPSEGDKKFARENNIRWLEIRAFGAVDNLEDSSKVTNKIYDTGNSSSPVKENTTRQDLSRPPQFPTSHENSISTAHDTTGGIDFRNLPIVTQAVSNLSGMLRDSPLRGQSLMEVNLDGEWEQIERMASSGVTPSSERIKEYIQTSCAQDSIIQDRDKILLCISDILRLEEERCDHTTPTLRDILVVLESMSNTQELRQVFLGKTI